MSENAIELPTVERSRMQSEKEKYNKEYIDEVYERLLKKRGIIMLPVEFNTTIDNIKNIISDYKDIARFVVKVNGDKYVVFRYKPIIKERIDVKSVLKEADEAYKSGNFKKSLEMYLDVLPIFSNPSAFIYSRIGLSLLRIGKKIDAVDYLLMATYMFRKEEKEVDYTELIDNIRFGPTGVDDKKVIVNMSDYEFDYWSEDSINMETFDKVNDYVLLTNLDLETACSNLGLTKEQEGIMKLLYAREFFIRKEIKKGEQFLKSYEESEYKTKDSKKLYEEIKRTKKLYANREVDNSKKLLLSLQPRSKKNN